MQERWLMFESSQSMFQRGERYSPKNLFTPAALLAGAPAEVFRGTVNSNAALAKLLIDSNPYFANSPMGRNLSATAEAAEFFSRKHVRPKFEIDSVRIGGEDVPIRLRTIDSTPFCSLQNFECAALKDAPKLLIYAPMSGHFATLLRGTVKTMLRRGFNVSITDWNPINEVPLSAGPFDVSRYVNTVPRFLHAIGQGSHILAVCQPVPLVMASVATMYENKNRNVPLSMTLMAGPVNPHTNPTKVNELATNNSIEWFKDNCIGIVRHPHAGAGRLIYPGELQLAAFVSMNQNRHEQAFRDLVAALTDNDKDKINKIRTFYREYLAVTDLSAPYYLGTIEQIFQKNALAAGTFTFTDSNGHVRRPDMRAITNTALLTVEGERDDICGIGQTQAAQDLCSNIPPRFKLHHLQGGAGHLGVFDGRRWDEEISPIVANHIYAANAAHELGLH